MDPKPYVLMAGEQVLKLDSYPGSARFDTGARYLRVSEMVSFRAHNPELAFESSPAPNMALWLIGLGNGLQPRLVRFDSG